MTTSSCAPQVRQGGLRSEAGSAYLATLLVLVVLTILGLSLAVITQTEVLIGGSEKQATRQLYSANSAIAIATGSEMVSAGSPVHKFSFAQRTEGLFGQTTVVADDVCISPYLQIATSICNLCTMNQDAEYSAVHYGVTAVALRRGSAALAARKSAGAVIAVEPWKENFSASQLASEDRFRVPIAEMDVDPTTEVDPCEGLYLKI